MSRGYSYIYSKTNLMVLLFLVMLIHFFVGSSEVFMPIIGNRSVPVAMIIYGMLFDRFEIHEILSLSGVILIILSALSYFAYSRSLNVFIKSMKNAIAKN